VYVVLVLGVTVGFWVDGIELYGFDAQEYVYVPVPPDGVACKLTDAPWHTVGGLADAVTDNEPPDTIIKLGV